MFRLRNNSPKQLMRTSGDMTKHAVRVATPVVLTPSSGSGSFFYTGSPVAWTVPAGVTSIDVMMWGAGGGAGLYSNGAQGGMGGFTWGTVTTTPGDTLYVNVGGGGQSTLTAAGNGAIGGYGGGGYGTKGDASGGGGGGYTGLFNSSGVAQANAILIAGGGGASTGYRFGGGGGGLSGGSGEGGTSAGSGGTQLAGGAGSIVYPGGGAGGALQGGNGAGNMASGGDDGGGGGGGYYGGGGGSNDAGGGGGGSGYCGSPSVVTGTLYTGLNGVNGYTVVQYPPLRDHAIYLASASVLRVGQSGKCQDGGPGAGAGIPGGDGYVHISWPGGQTFLDGSANKPFLLTPGISEIRNFSVDPNMTALYHNSPGTHYAKYFTFSVPPGMTVDAYVGYTTSNRDTQLYVFTGSTAADLVLGNLVAFNDDDPGSDAHLSWNSHGTFNTVGQPGVTTYIMEATTWAATQTYLDLKARVVIT